MLLFVILRNLNMMVLYKGNTEPERISTPTNLFGLMIVKYILDLTIQPSYVVVLRLCNY